MKRSSRETKFRRVKTDEEVKVEMVLVLGFLSGFFLFVALTYVITPLPRFLTGLGYPNAAIGIIVVILSFHALVSFLWGLWFHFSRRQYWLLAKYALVFDGGLSLGFAGFNYLVYAVIAGVLSNPQSPAIFIVGGMNLVFIGFVWVLKRLFGERVSLWFRMKYIPDNASLELASKSLKKAEQELSRKNYEGGSQAFHFAAVVYINLELWEKAAENYWLAAENLSKKTNSHHGFGTAWLYALSASTYSLSRNAEKAEEALELGKTVLKIRQVDKKAEKKISLILDFLTAILKKNTLEAANLWKNLDRKLSKWGYPTTEETIILLERNLDLLKSDEPSRELN